jgi:hypothetical protein
MAIYLKNIKFPIYPIPKTTNAYVEGSQIRATSNTTDLIIDDKSVEGYTLGIRRLHIEKKLLYPLRKSISNIGNFFLYSSIYSTYVDSMGKLFKYKKQTRVPLIYKKIIVSAPYKSGTMLLMEDIHCPMWYYRPISPGKEYAALLYMEKGYVLLGVTDKPSTRTVYKV